VLVGINGDVAFDDLSSKGVHSTLLSWTGRLTGVVCSRLRVDGARIVGLEQHLPIRAQSSPR
jgi:hypothetical protein